MKTKSKAELIAHIELLTKKTKQAEFLVTELKNDLCSLKEILEFELEKEFHQVKEIVQSKPIKKSRGIF